MFQHLLFPTDGSDFATQIIPHVRTLAAAAGKVTVLHVFPGPVSGRVRCGDDWEGDLTAGQARAMQIVLASKERLEREYSGQVEIATFVGHPGQTICEAAGILDCDGIIIGTHGYGWLEELAVGSVSAYVIRNADQPVILIRPDRSLILPAAYPGSLSAAGPGAA